jgi:hypothetical protein
VSRGGCARALPGSMLFAAADVVVVVVVVVVMAVVAAEMAVLIVVLASVVDARFHLQRCPGRMKRRPG